MGRITKINKEANKKIKEMFLETDIRSCEARLSKCTGSFALSFAHRHKRAWYYSEPSKLWDFKQVILCCMPCHSIIEDDKELTEKVFNELRGNE